MQLLKEERLLQFLRDRSELLISSYIFMIRSQALTPKYWVS